MNERTRRLRQESLDAIPSITAERALLLLEAALLWFFPLPFDLMARFPLPKRLRLLRR